MRWIAVAWLVCGCIEPDLVQCGDELCGVGAVCTPTGCAPREQVSACAGLEPSSECAVGAVPGVCVDGLCVIARCGNSAVEHGEVCDDGNTVGGDGCSGTCTSDESCGNGILELAEQCDCGTTDVPGQLALCAATVNGETVCSTTCSLLRCGNSVLDPGEVCDDGNTMPGDGCSFDCGSDETCGNGVLDYFAGETCDDMNATPYDGCSRICGPDVPPIWTRRLLTPSPRSNASVAYDSRRQRIVLFDGQYTGDTWEWDGKNWIERFPLTVPLPRSGAAMAYDRKRGRALMFGGSVPDGLGNELWSWDGSDWTRIMSPNPPPPRRGHDMVYDTWRDALIVYGDNDPDDPQSTTWKWDGAQWTEVVGESPPVRIDSALAFDPSRGATIMLGGLDPGSSAQIPALDDRWELDESGDWFFVSSGEPPARSQHAMAWDGTSGLVVHGGFDGVESNWTDTWRFYDDTWVGPTAGSERLNHAMVWDAAREQNVLVGGGVSGFITEVLPAGSTIWKTITPASPPDVRGGAAAWDDRRGKLVVFLGSPLRQTWEWDGRGWTQRLPVDAPTGTGPKMVYDAARAVMVLVISNGFNTPAVTWEWNDTNWTQTSLVLPRVGGLHLAYDRARAITVLLTMNFVNSDYVTYELEAGAWMLRSPATNPGPHARGVMAYDERRQRTIVFGGLYGATLNAETWAWDGVDWTRLLPATSPGPVLDATAVYDRDRGRIVMFGGSTQLGATGRVWEWDGTTWREVTARTKASACYGHLAGYDPIHREMIVFGGATGTGTQTFRYEGEPDEACESQLDLDGDGLVGCDDPSCWAVCTPLCAPGTSCPSTAPRCGDGTCSEIESCRLCPGDCGPCARCGDMYCDGAETKQTCAADCEAP